jgi:hypothetical protein
LAKIVRSIILASIVAVLGCGGSEPAEEDPPDAASMRLEIADMRVETTRRYACTLSDFNQGSCADYDVSVRFWNGSQVQRGGLMGGWIEFEQAPGTRTGVAPCTLDPWSFPPGTLSDWLQIRVLWVFPDEGTKSRTEILCGDRPDTWSQSSGLPFEDAPGAGTAVNVILTMAGNDLTRTALISN